MEDTTQIVLRTEHRQLYFVTKRILDALVSGVLLLMLLPLMLIIALAIRLDSPGPIFFTQARVTAKRRYRNGRWIWEKEIFKLYKFRSMVPDADSSLHIAYVQANINNDAESMQALQQGNDTTIRKLAFDPRVTRIGHLLRKTSLDELPQLWNALVGDISLVGPRPPIPYELDLYKPWYHRRLDTIPGVTGWWQTTARSSASYDEMVELDIWYVANQSLWLDLKILIMTPVAVLLSRDSAA
jgi:lipopolysaccharide/colanic/teichoic acid biosynthesis glycosyltransferase